MVIPKELTKNASSAAKAIAPNYDDVKPASSNTVTLYTTGGNRNWYSNNTMFY